MRTEDYHSGEDVELAYLDWTFRFARDDFEQRVVDAAVELDLVRAPVDRRTRAELFAIAADGSTHGCRTRTATRIAALDGDEDPVYWLRKLVFRSAWLDHRIKHGVVDVRFEERTGSFVPIAGAFPLPDEPTPRFARVSAPEDGR
jgi:hypothetical protein